MSNSFGKSFLKDFKYLIIFILLVLALFHRFFLFGEVLIGGDLINNYIPYKHIFVEQIKSGQFPFWNPYTFSGKPFYADIQIGVFYPLNWLFILLPIPMCFTLLVILHLIIGGVGIFYYACEFVRERIYALISAIIFILSGFFSIRIYTGVVLFIFTGVWAPIVFLLLNRWFKKQNFKYIGWLAFVISMQILAGSPQIAFYTIFCVIIFVLSRWIFWGKIAELLTEGRNLSDDSVESLKLNVSGGFNKFKVLVAPIVAIILSFLISAIQILPTHQLIKYSFDRAGGARWEYVIDGSLNIKGLLTYIVPFFFYYPWDESLYWGMNLSFWELNNYLGILPIVFIFFYIIFQMIDGKLRVFFKRSEKITLNQFSIFTWCIVILLSLTLAFGGNSPLFRLFYIIIPGFNVFRDPVRIIFLYTIGIALLTGIATEYFANAYLQTPRKKTLKLTLLIIFFLLTLFVGFVIFEKYPDIIMMFGFGDIFQVSYESIKNLKLPDHLVSPVLTAYSGLMKSVALFLFSALIIFSAQKKWLSKNIILSLVILTIIFDLGIFAGRFVNLGNNSVFKNDTYKYSEVVKFLDSVKDEGRFTYLDDVNYWINDQNQIEIFPNRGVMYGLYDARGYDPVSIRYYAEMINVAAGFNPDKPPGGFLFLPEIRNASLLSLLNVKYILSYSDLSPLGFKVVKAFSFGLNIYENPKSAGWAYLRKGVPVVPEDKQELVLRILTSEKYDSNECAIVPEPYNYSEDKKVSLMNQAATEYVGNAYMRSSQEKIHTPNPSQEGILEEIKVVKYSANEKIYKVSVNQPQLVVFSEIYYPGWKVYVNGVRQKLMRVNYVLMGVYVTDTTKEIKLVFRPLIFYVGLIISALSIIGVVFLLIIHRNRIEKSQNKFYSPDSFIRDSETSSE